MVFVCLFYLFVCFFVCVSESLLLSASFWVRALFVFIFCICCLFVYLICWVRALFFCYIFYCLNSIKKLYIFISLNWHFKRSGLLCTSIDLPQNQHAFLNVHVISLSNFVFTNLIINRLWKWCYCSGVDAFVLHICVFMDFSITSCIAIEDARAVVFL